MKIYQYKTSSNAAPFFSDESSGFIESDTSMKALKSIVKNYKHPAGLYAAIISECSVENKMLCRYLSSKANTVSQADIGKHEYKNGKLFVNDIEVEVEGEAWETFE